ncbi:hypothetical protein GCM10007028_34110 [Algibacter mikhailovii]|uniref:Uncharacterized protein n=1 Tax=Algibacter mikhailovii TaxID=425498 RepID=A0A918RBL4_9FLAO|nr:hypothetical protein GCM10007028_34110 [Algibacter mikhailovii]
MLSLQKKNTGKGIFTHLTGWLVKTKTLNNKIYFPEIAIVLYSLEREIWINSKYYLMKILYKYIVYVDLLLLF